MHQRQYVQSQKYLSCVLLQNFANPGLGGYQIAAKMRFAYVQIIAEKPKII